MAYIAIKNTEHKGVYEEKGFNKSLFGTKGISYRKFQKNELEEALKWAGVKDLKVNTVKAKTAKDNVSINPFEQIILKYTQTGNEVVQLELVNGHKICITTKDIFYRISDYSTQNLFYNQCYDNEKREYVWELDEEKIVKNIDNIRSIYKTKLEFFENGIRIENYGELESPRYREYSYPYGEVYIPNNSILMVKPLGRWTKPEEYLRITEKRIIDIYKRNN